MPNWLLYTITVLVWGSTWMAIEYQLGVVPPEVSVFFRYLVAAALLFGWCAWKGVSLRFNMAAHRRFIQLGVALFSLNYILTYYAQAYITSALTAIVFSTMLWMNILNSRLFFGTAICREVIVGSSLGIAGIAVLFAPEVDMLSFGDTAVFGSLLAIAGAYVASLGNMASQAAQTEKIPVLQANAWGMLYGALLTGVTAAAQGHRFVPDLSAAYLLSLAYLAIFGSIIGFGVYLTLLGRIGAGRAAYAVVMFPVVAIVISALSGEMQPGWDTLFGIGLVMAGNVLVLRSRQRTADQRGAPIKSRMLSRFESSKRISP
jgi:drug/metabolite transporter (DMT)-like permease